MGGEMNRLAPLSEEPFAFEEDNSKSKSSKCTHYHTWSKWLRNHFTHKKSSDLKILLSVVACPLFPVSIDNPKHYPIPQVCSSAEYIIEHFMAATGWRKVEGAMKNMYASGKVTMGMVDEAGVSQKGCFVIWKMVPNKWLIELVVSGHKVVAGSDGKVAWRHTPWLPAHAAKGPARPLRRAIQGLDPLGISSAFSAAEHVGEKQISGVDCFVLKLSAERADLAERSDTSAEMIKHVTLGYFSQRSGLLVYLEDSYLTRIQTPGCRPTYWETTTSTKIDDYRSVDGIMISHSGQSSVVITRFGDTSNFKAGHGVTRMEESYTIDDLAFNVPGLSPDSFIPPKEMHIHFPQHTLNWRSPLHR